MAGAAVNQRSSEDTVRSPQASGQALDKSAATSSGDYFSVSGSQTTRSKVSFSPDTVVSPRNRSDATASTESTGSSTSASTPTDRMLGESRRSSNDTNGDAVDEEVGLRKSSATSVAFRLPDPRFPQGISKGFNAGRVRSSSPRTIQFQHHVGFDNVAIGEATKHNTASCTINVRHSGYHPKRRSRTFMAGVDEHAYSNYALSWLLTSLVDDGDEVVCVRVIENSVRVNDAYREHARKMIEDIQAKNTLNKAISIILEYSVGKLHATFQQLIQIYQPSMLIVGTKGRSLGGLQGLMNTNSFSKYCLQYSPVPVVVVRPDKMRKKKKEKRTVDNSRQTYQEIIKQKGGKHEIDSEASSAYELETTLSPDEEAHKVAAAIGLPARFDPTIKPYKPDARRSSPHVRRSSSLAGSSRHRSPPPESAGTVDTGDEESGEEDEYEVEAVSGEALLQQDTQEQELVRQQKQKLHAMEMGEAKALLKSGAESDDDPEEDEEDDDPQEGASLAKS